MWVTEELSLIDFYRHGKILAQEAGYEVLLCFVARDADAPNAYKEIVDTWRSLDDLTGPKILFLFAGSSIREHEESQNIYDKGSERLLFSSDALLMPSSRMKSEGGQRRQVRTHSTIGHQDLQRLKDHTEEFHPLTRKDPRVLAKHRPDEPRHSDISNAQTSQISRLRDYLALNEADVPCFHLSFLNNLPPVHVKLNGNSSIYPLLKSIVETLESKDTLRLKQDVLDCMVGISRMSAELEILKKKAVSPAEEYTKTIRNLREIANERSKGEPGVLSLIAALRNHANEPSEETRIGAFAAFNELKDHLCQRSDWNAVRSEVQRLIDIAHHKPWIDVSSSTEEEISRREQLRKEEQLRLQTRLSELVARKGELQTELNTRLAPAAIHSRVKNALVSEKGALPLPTSVIVVAARQELAAIRRYLDEIGSKRQPIALSNDWRAERVEISGPPAFQFILILSPGQGVEDMGETLSFVQKEVDPEVVLLVGMMAAIPGKSRLLDVQVPRNVINGTRLGTRDGQIVPEPHGRDVDPVLHNRIQAMDSEAFGIADIPMVTHKNSVCVAAKFDDLLPELAQAALAADPENIVGLEMEGSALTAKQAGQRRNGGSTGFLMIKGVADYAGDNPKPNEIETLSAVLKGFRGEDAETLLQDPDPTSNKPLKSMLQELATIRALRVALALLEDSSV